MARPKSHLAAWLILPGDGPAASSRLASRLLGRTLGRVQQRNLRLFSLPRLNTRISIHPIMSSALRLVASFAVLFAALSPPDALAEPRIILGPAEPDEEPEVVETISGLSYDQLKRLRELRKWLEDRRMIRERIRLADPAHRESASQDSLFADRALFAPLGQRYAGKLPDPRPADARTLKLPPLPRFEPEEPMAADSERASDGGETVAIQGEDSPPPRRVTHISPPPNPGARDPVQIEYELKP